MICCPETGLLPTWASNRLISQRLSRQPDLGPIEELAKRSAQDAGATQVPHGGERERRAEVFRGTVGLMRRRGRLEVHFALLHVSVVRSSSCPFILSKLVLQHLNLICKYREFVKGGDGTTLRNLYLGYPAQEVQLPERQVRWQELGKQKAL